MLIPMIHQLLLQRESSANDSDSRAADGRERRDERDRHEDPHVTRALAAMKADPSRRWTVAALARVGGLSRAAFARRFTRALGVSPLRWLTEHRLGLAQRSLLETDLTLTGIAAEIGYQSEFAFAKAFKRLFGMAPGLFRRTASIPSVFRAAA